MYYIENHECGNDSLTMHFFIWTNSEEKLERFLKEFNGFHLNIKFTFKKSKMKVNFLGAMMKIKNYNSCHAEHVKNSIIYSQALRLR